MKVPKKYAGWLAGVAVVLVGVSCTETPTTLTEEGEFDPLSGADQPRERFNDVDFVASPSLGGGLPFSHSGVPLHSIDIAGVGANFGFSAAIEAVGTGDVPGTFTAVDSATFNALSVADLRTAYDVLIFTWVSDTGINADWNTRLLPYMALGGGILFEDPNNVSDLAPGVIADGEPFGSPCTGSGGHTVTDTVPGLTDGIVSGAFANNHICFSSWDAALSPFLAQTSVPSVTGLWGGFGTGCIVLTGPDQHFHGSKFGVPFRENQYNLLVNELHFVSHGCGETVIPAGDSATIVFEDSTTGVFVPPGTFPDTAVIVRAEFVGDCHAFLIAQIGECLKLEFIDAATGLPLTLAPDNEIILGLCFDESEFTGPEGGFFSIFGFAGNPTDPERPSEQNVNLSAEVPAPFLDCTAFTFFSSASTNPLIRLASGGLNLVKQWFAPRPLMATIMVRDGGFGRSPASPFYTWARRAIDIKFDSDPNSINCRDPESRSVIPVALLSVDLNEDGDLDDPGDFDATEADHTTVRFGPTGSEASETHRRRGEARRHEEDVNGDGHTDLEFHFRYNKTGLDCDDTFAKLIGQTFGGETFETADFVRMVGGNDE